MIIKSYTCSFVERILRQMKDNGRVRRPYWGVTRKAAGSGTGVVIKKIKSNGLASQAGLKLVVTNVDKIDKKIENDNDFFKWWGYRIKTIKRSMRKMTNRAECIL